MNKDYGVWSITWLRKPNAPNGNRICLNFLDNLNHLDNLKFVNSLSKEDWSYLSNHPNSAVRAMFRLWIKLPGNYPIF